MSNEKAETYVTFKWLIGTTLSSFGILVAIIGIMSSMAQNTLNSKVNMELYNSQHKELCSDIEEIKTSGNETKKSMTVMNANMALVMRALKIEPVK